MRDTIKKALVTAGTLLALFLAAGREASGAVGIWVGYGYGFSNSSKQYEQETFWDYSSYATRTMKASLDYRVRISSKKSPVGFSFEVYTQDYEEAYVELYQGMEQRRERYKERFGYCGGTLDYSFFPKRKLDPYIGLGLFGLLYIDLFGSGPPPYPATVALKLIGGVRYKLGRRVNIDASADYLPANGIVSLRMGLEFIL